MDDKSIIDLLYQRCESALSQVRDKYGALCLSVAYSVLSSAEDAEECVNDMYLKVWNSIPPARPDNFKAYVAKLTRNLSIDRLRTNTRKKRAAEMRDVALSELEACLPGGTSPEDVLSEKELASAISVFLRGIPEEERLIFVGRYWNYLSTAELAQKFGCSRSRVKSMLFRTRAELREKLEKEGYYI